jgi:hypothetical protein
MSTRFVQKNTRLIKYAFVLSIVLHLFVSPSEGSSPNTLTFVAKPSAESEQERLQFSIDILQFTH